MPPEKYLYASYSRISGAVKESGFFLVGNGRFWYFYGDSIHFLQ